MYDFLIVGQGIAGSSLAWHLIEAGKKIAVIDNGNLNNVSHAASGIINPITGKRFVKSWLIDTLQPYALQCYRKIEADLNVSFLKELTIYHVLNSIEEVNDWSIKAATDGYTQYLSNFKIHALAAEKVLNPNGCFEVQGALKINARLFLQVIKHKIRQSNLFIEDSFDENALTITPHKICYQNIEAQYIIFATGFDAAQSALFTPIKFSPVKGEGLFIEIKNFYPENIIHGDVLISPTNEKDVYYAGSTYEWQFTNDQPTESKLHELTQRIKNTIRCNFSILQHVAGIRPASKNRRPIIGLLPNSRIGIFNGMGTKGFSLSPYFAKHFCQHLLEETDLLPEVDVKRFF